MPFESEFRAILTGSSAVTDIVPAARLNWGEAPQGAAAPYVCLWLISHFDRTHLRGVTGLFESRVQIDVYAATAKQAMDLGEIIASLLHGYSSGGFQLIRREGTRGPNRETGTNEPTRLHRRSHDFFSHWRE